MAAAVPCGADGAIVALPNVAPRICVALYEAARRHAVDSALELQARVAELFRIFELPGRSGDSAYHAGHKAALELLGRSARMHGYPYGNLTETSGANFLLVRNVVVYSPERNSIPS